VRSIVENGDKKCTDRIANRLDTEFRVGSTTTTTAAAAEPPAPIRAVAASSPAAEENADDDARRSSAPVAPTPSNTASSLAVARYAARYIIVDDFIPPVAFAFVAFPFVAYRYVVLFIYFCTKRTIVGEEVTQNFPPLYEAPRINSYVGRNR
jgi:hypothetical protein